MVLTQSHPKVETVSHQSGSGGQRLGSISKFSPHSNILQLNVKGLDCGVVRQNKNLAKNNFISTLFSQKFSENRLIFDESPDLIPDAAGEPNCSTLPPLSPLH